MAFLDFVVGKKRIVTKNCVRDPSDSRVSHCEIEVHEDKGVTRKGNIDVIGDNKTVYPLRKTGGLTDEDFSDTISFLKRGGWQKIVPNIKSVMDKEESQE